MKRLLRGRSDLAIASTIFYLSGVLFSVVLLWVFPTREGRLDWFLLFLGIASLAFALLFFFAADRIPRAVVLGVASLAGVLLLVGVQLNGSVMRAMNTGVIFFALLMYLVWFAPTWWWRTFSYGWLLAFTLIMGVRFENEVRAFLVTVACTAIILAEVIGVFKRRLERTSLTDPLCGIWNKRAFDASLDRAIAVAHRYGWPLTVVLIDLNGFKTINDTKGHVEGDRVLREFARAVERGIRAQDVFARIGGDEFALLLTSTSVEESGPVLTRLQREVDFVTWSYGSAALVAGDGAQSLLQRADRAMYAQKGAHRQPRAAGRLGA